MEKVWKPDEVREILRKRNSIVMQETAFEIYTTIYDSVDGGYILAVDHLNHPCCRTEVYETKTLEDAKARLREAVKNEYLEQLEDLTYTLNEFGYEYPEECADVERRWNALTAQKGTYYATADDTQRIKNYVVNGRSWMLDT